jgi:hypothetical protein
MKTFEEIAEKNNMPLRMKERFIAYMRARWSDEEEIQCQTGYAQEWAERFLSHDEYGCSDGVGQEVLAEIDSGNFKQD